MKTTYDLKVTGKRSRDRQKMYWPQLLDNDRSSWALKRSDPKDRKTWREDVKSAMLDERSPAMVVPLFLHENQREPAVGRVGKSCTGIHVLRT